MGAWAVPKTAALFLLMGFAFFIIGLTSSDPFGLQRDPLDVQKNPEPRTCEEVKCVETKL
jgi:hypothetical protein